MTFRTALLLILTALSAGCRTHWIEVADDSSTGVLLAKSEDESGTRRTWRVYPGVRHEPRIDVSSSTVRTVSRVGLSVSPVNRERAEFENVEPWKGVWVDSAQSGLPAARAGIVRGDIVLQVAGQDVSSPEQFTDLLKTHAKPDEELELTLRVRRKRGEPMEDQGTATVKLVPEGVEVRDSRTDSIPLEHSAGVQTYTGIQAAGVPTDVARSVYSTNEPVVLVTRVVTGSPAYLAGLRTGDRITRIDGRTVDSINDLRAAVFHRLRTDYPAAPTKDLAHADMTLETRAGDIQFEVTGPLGPHACSVAVADDLEDSTEFYIPIVYSHESDIKRADVEFLDFIFQFGFNYDSRLRPSKTREPISTWELSILPFGMFEFEKRIDRNEYTFFWWISFETRR